MKQTTQTPLTDRATVAVWADPAKNLALLKSAARLAVDLNLPLLERPKKRGHEILFVVTPNRLELRVVGGHETLRGGRAIAVDLTKLDTVSPAGRRLKQPLFKAIGLGRKKQPRPTVIDATAGFGEDAWLLAAIGCQVLAVERNGVVATLLRDGLLRAGATQPDTLARLHVINTNSFHLLRRLHSHRGTPDKDFPPEMAGFLQPGVVYLDPMFPPGRKTAERKPMKVLRWLVGDDQDAERLLDAALSAARQRVVVKRPIKAAPLGSRRPTTTHKGKALRYDVYSVK